MSGPLPLLRVFNCYPGGKAVYIAPLKALVRERVDDWYERMERRLGKKVVELTGDSSPDIRAIERADVIVTTPEKWDGISRSWQNRSVYSQDILVYCQDMLSRYTSYISGYCCNFIAFCLYIVRIFLCTAWILSGYSCILLG